MHGASCRSSRKRATCSRSPAGEGVIRLGIPEDFAAHRLTELLSNFMRSRPGLRLDVRSGLSVQSRRALERGELDLALYKRDAGERGGIAAWPERLHWVTSRKHPIDFDRDPVPLAMSEQGCLYRARMIHAMKSAGRAWYMAYTSPSVLGIQAAVSVGLGVSILLRGRDPAGASRAQTIRRLSARSPTPRSRLWRRRTRAPRRDASPRCSPNSVRAIRARRPRRRRPVSSSGWTPAARRCSWCCAG